ncbi:hypothetical protein [Lactobacillus sp. PSON]|uniref:hypothetical protein n=1 Tax=Lactobacillus sp. PSON TaxID=3455454 RepID=UPI004041CA4E
MSTVMTCVILGSILAGTIIISFIISGKSLKIKDAYANFIKIISTTITIPFILKSNDPVLTSVWGLIFVCIIILWFSYWPIYKEKEESKEFKKDYKRIYINSDKVQIVIRGKGDCETSEKYHVNKETENLENNKGDTNKEQKSNKKKDTNEEDKRDKEEDKRDKKDTNKENKNNK